MNNVVEKTENRPTREPRNENRGWVRPAVDIVENKDGYHLEAEMPGVDKDGLEVLLEGNELTLIGRRTREVGDAQLLYRESIDRDFRRSFELDPTIDAGRIRARIENGVLHLDLPKAEEVKPRRISID